MSRICRAESLGSECVFSIFVCYRYSPGGSQIGLRGLVNGVNAFHGATLDCGVATVVSGVNVVNGVHGAILACGWVTVVNGVNGASLACDHFTSVAI